MLNSHAILTGFNRLAGTDKNSETALLRMLSCVYLAEERGARTMLLQLDLPSAFDTLDISSLLRRLK